MTKAPAKTDTSVPVYSSITIFVREQQLTKHNKPSGLVVAKQGITNAETIQ
ncbi:MAG: hypothetical protein V7761_00215 [Amylibacter sp.]